MLLLTLAVAVIHPNPSPHVHKLTNRVISRQVEAQPVIAMARRVEQALELLGEPLPASLRVELTRASESKDDRAAVAAIEKVLDRRTLLNVTINPESRVTVIRGTAEPKLVETGWRAFLIKVTNQAGVTSELKVESPQARRLANSPQSDVRDRWLDLSMFNSQPLTPRLSGLGLEYRIILLYSRDAGQREAKLSFHVGQGTQDLGFRSEVDLLFQSAAASKVTLNIKDSNGKPTTAMLVFRDALGRVYPSQAKRLAPDFAFQPQIYRANGEVVRLPKGKYRVEVTRGPEYRTKVTDLVVQGSKQSISFQLERWVDPAKLGWWSGDHHIHAAGCAHYENPTQGVHAPDMIRHCLGEDLKVGCNLTWGPCFDYQKQFFTGKDDPVSQYPYLLRYDIEVSGFGSHESGHLCLLRLKDQMYPGGTSKDHWPKLGLNTLRWAKKQGAVVGPAHSGFGLQIPNADVPSYVVPPFDGIGANEYIMDVTHTVPGPDGTLVPAVDFMSTVDTPYVWEMNIWYHTLNCGYRTRISGETDFPCIYGERVGLGRSYVRLGDKLDFDAWCEGIRQGKNYVSDGKSHIIDFKVGSVAMGEGASELKLDRPGRTHVTAKVCAMLSEAGDPTMKKRNYAEKPYWNVERARIGDSRMVPVELIVNGLPVARQEIIADGAMKEIAFDVSIEHSSWVAMRILPSSHTNPVFVLVGGKPIRASRRSAQWCADGLENCWKNKRQFYARNPEDLRQAELDYNHARQAYRKIFTECEVE